MNLPLAKVLSLLAVREGLNIYNEYWMVLRNFGILAAFIFLPTLS